MFKYVLFMTQAVAKKVDEVGVWQIFPRLSKLFVIYRKIHPIYLGHNLRGGLCRRHPYSSFWWRSYVCPVQWEFCPHSPKVESTGSTALVIIKIPSIMPWSVPPWAPPFKMAVFQWHWKCHWSSNDSGTVFQWHCRIFSIGWSFAFWNTS